MSLLVAPPYRVVNSAADMAQALAAVQRVCFPTLAEHELITAAHYRKHVEVFPEGQFAVLGARDEVVACSTDFITTVDLDHIEHRYLDAVAGNWLTNHDPEGDWLYGADIGVKPEYRGKGVSKLLYRARRELIVRLGLKGHVAGGMLSGYGAYRAHMSVEEYVAKLKVGELFDPTVSVQLRRGFTVHGIIHDYVDDSSCDGKAAFLLWRNPQVAG